jgi:hypothetical protein
MTEHEAELFNQTLSGLTTDDGEHALIKLQGVNESETTIAVPRNGLPKLIDLAAAVLSKGRKLAGCDPDEKLVFDASWYEVGSDPAAGSVVLSLTFGLGGTISFAMNRAMAERLLETLKIGLRGSIPEKPSGPAH